MKYSPFSFVGLAQNVANIIPNPVKKNPRKIGRIWMLRNAQEKRRKPTTEF